MKAPARRQGRASTATRRTPRRSPSPTSRSPSACCPSSRSSSARCRSPRTRRPARQEFADTRRPLRQGHRHDHPGQPRHDHLRHRPEDAYFKTEIIDAYCRILILAKQLGTVNYYTDEQGRRADQDQAGARHPRRPARAGPGELRPLRQQPLPRGLQRLRARAPGVHPAEAPDSRRRGDAARALRPAPSADGDGPRVARPDDHRPGHARDERRGRRPGADRVDGQDYASGISGGV